MTPEERTEYNRKKKNEQAKIHYYKNLEKNRERCKQNYYKNLEKNREKNKERCKQKYYKNVEKNREINRNYAKSAPGKKTGFKSLWKKRGLNMKHFEIIYLLYLSTTNCDKCHCILTDGKPIKSTTKCLDHSHKTGKFRNILCHSCNVKRKEDNF